MSRSYELRLIHIANIEAERKVIDGVPFVRLTIDMDIPGPIRPPVKVRLSEEDRAFIEEWQRTHTEDDGHVIKDRDRGRIDHCSAMGCTNVPLIVEYLGSVHDNAKGLFIGTGCREHNRDAMEAKREAARRRRGWKELGISI